MTEDSQNQVSASGFAPHIKELHDFFRSRSLRFGAPEDLGSFVERLQKDESFRDEMSSMVRAIIYRERDGLRPDELLGLLVMAVAGMPVENAPEQVREAVGQMRGFIGGVFRSRWNPGGGSARGAEDKAGDRTAVDVEGAKGVAPLPLAENDAASGTTEETAARPVTPIFYQAQVVASGEEPEGVLPLRQANEAASEAGGAATPGPSTDEEIAALPVTAFLRGEGTTVIAPPEPERGRSRAGMWIAFVIAIVLAFGAGMFVRQWMLLRSGVRSPAHVANPSVTPSAANSRIVSPPDGGAASASSGGRSAARRSAQVEAARSAWQGGSESATDLVGPGGGAGAGQRDRLAANSAAGSTGAAGPQPMASVTKPSPEVRANGLRSGAGRAPERGSGIVGASPGLMSDRLLFAPEPEYPAMARLTHVQGRVVVEAEVGADGSVVWARAISGHRMLRAAAERAVYGHKYRPYIVNDRPTKVQTLVTVNFRLP